jgi:hypothetical protein
MNRVEQLIAYVDGELAPAEAARFEAQIADDPALASQVAAHRALVGRVGQAYAPVLEEDVPLRLRLTAQAANDRGLPRWTPWAAAVASLAIGVLAGRTLEPGRLVVGSDVPARLQVARALDRGLAADGGAVRLGVTFRDGRGRYCRSFESAPDDMAGLACRQDSRWRLETAAAWRPAAGPAYRTAASETPPAVLAAVDALMAGETLDAAQERSARDGGWAR